MAQINSQFLNSTELWWPSHSWFLFNQPSEIEHLETEGGNWLWLLVETHLEHVQSWEKVGWARVKSPGDSGSHWTACVAPRKKEVKIICARDRQWGNSTGNISPGGGEECRTCGGRLCYTEKVDDLLLGPAELGEPLWKCVVIWTGQQHHSSASHISSRNQFYSMANLRRKTQTKIQWFVSCLGKILGWLSSVMIWGRSEDRHEKSLQGDLFLLVPKTNKAMQVLALGIQVSYPAGMCWVLLERIRDQC